MIKSFEPYFKKKEPLVFNQWEASSEPVSLEPIIDEQELLNLTCQKLKEEAKAAGYEEGLNQAKEEIQAKQKEFSKALHALLQPMHLLDEIVIKDIVKTMLWVCQACIGIELSVHPEKLLCLFTMIKEELPTLKGNKILALNPEDLEWVRLQTLEGVFADIESMLIADTALARGDFYLQSDQSVLDGQISTRLSNLFSEYISKADLINIPVEGKE